MTRPIPEEFLPGAPSPTITPGGQGGGWGTTGGQGAKRQQVQWGRDIQVPPSAGGVFTNGVAWHNAVMTPETDEPVEWTINVQPSKLANTEYPVAGDLGYLYIQVHYTLGGITFTRGPYLLTSLTAERFHVVGRRVQVDVVWSSVGPTHIGDAPITVSVGAAEGGVTDSPLDFYFGRWDTAPVGASHTFAVTPGKLMAYNVSLLTMSSDPYLYLVYVDTGAPVSGATKTFWNSPPFTAAGQWYSFAADPDVKINWNVAGTWVLSSTPDVYTAPTGTTPAALVRSKIGF